MGEKYLVINKSEDSGLFAHSWVYEYFKLRHVQHYVVRLCQRLVDSRHEIPHRLREYLNIVTGRCDIRYMTTPQRQDTCRIAAST
jgi:uncharacterized membrane protein YgaE (UPF0421/DUF939 family)